MGYYTGDGSQYCQLVIVQILHAHVRDVISLLIMSGIW